MEMINLDSLKMDDDYSQKDIDGWLFEKEGREGGQKWLFLSYIKLIKEWKNFLPIYSKKFYELSFDLKEFWQGESKEEALKEMEKKAEGLIKGGWSIHKTAGRA